MIKDLCVKIGVVTMGNEGHDTIIFTRGDKGMDQNRYQIYGDEVILSLY